MPLPLLRRHALSLAPNTTPSTPITGQTPAGQRDADERELRLALDEMLDLIVRETRHRQQDGAMVGQSAGVEQPSS
ncbi:hypothetical protein [Streptomyces sp. IB201691-2A2]|uniref:hypothetical protein n=1 Tax=Streptomyces sp. IB201691-2A2 TaxID=2561920 RepID=UPI001180D6AF|nr:hypothetical protein [Streptomyces sp. IB201691-2A2]TRO58380.1 hypothetical protein E4K73_39575 [Streptomyces sp. IB201691-2A2]